MHRAWTPKKEMEKVMHDKFCLSGLRNLFLLQQQYSDNQEFIYNQPRLLKKISFVKLGGLIQSDCVLSLPTGGMSPRHGHQTNQAITIAEENVRLQLKPTLSSDPAHNLCRRQFDASLSGQHAFHPHPWIRKGVFVWETKTRNVLYK